MSDLAAYHAEIARKRVAFEPRGLSKIPVLNKHLKPHQEASVVFALETGSSASFLGTGLGKTLVELEFGRIIAEATNRPVLMSAPLACAMQHQDEAAKFDIDAVAIREAAEVDGARVYITNYDRLERFSPKDFPGIILDESSILKNFSGVTSRQLIDDFSETPYRLCGTATPAPNDYTELGQHSAFLGVMRSSEMLSRWFITDQSLMGRYRLKAPAVRPFFDWMASWSRALTKPSDLGFPDDGYDLPELIVERHPLRADVTIEPGQEKDGQGRLFRLPEINATSIHREKRLTVEQRTDAVAERVLQEPDEFWVLWCDTDYEADALLARLPDAVEVRGSQSIGEKERKLGAFARGQIKWLVTKPRIAGWGPNWQHCARMALAGMSFSFESYHQIVRRCWRFGQPRDVRVFIPCVDTEEVAWTAVSRKSGDYDAMQRHMVEAMRRAARIHRPLESYTPALAAELPSFLRAA